MIDLQGFESSAAAVRGDAVLELARHGPGVTTRTGRIARWASRFRSTQNTAVATGFVVSLRARHGAEITDQALRSTGLDRALTAGKPLRARHVNTLVHRAKQLQADFARSNVSASDLYRMPVAVGADVSRLRIKIDHLARKLYPECPQVARFVNLADLDSAVRDEIGKAGRGGKHLVIAEEASGIVDSLVRRQLESVYTSHTNALRKLALDHPGSLAGGALSQAMANGEFAGSFQPERLSRDAREMLEGRIREIVDNELAPSALTDEAAARTAADRLMSDFVAARDAAGRAVLALPVEPADREALLNQVLHDNVPAALVPRLGHAFVETRRDLQALGKPMNAREIQQPLAQINESIERAFADSDTRITPRNQHALYRGFWRCLLAPAEDTQVAGIAERVGLPGSPLRAVGEGANWYSQEFPHTREAERILGDGGPNDPGEPAYSLESFRKAGEYAVTLSALADVLGEREGVQHGDLKLGARDTLSDEVIVTMRNLGISMPASGRVGESNRTDYFSEPTIAKVQDELDFHFNGLRNAKMTDGVVSKSIADLTRATYDIDGTALPWNLDAVIGGLRKFCTDQTGGLDEEMLKCVSGMVNQGTIHCVYSACLTAEHPHLSLISGVPVVNGGMTYNLSKDRSGDVLLNIVKAGSPAVLGVQDENFGVQPVFLDPENSHLDVQARIRLVAPTWKPTLEHIEIAYSLFPDPRVD